MQRRYDFAIIGAGMAGASLAAALAKAGRVLLIEAEAQGGYHATGRSAAFWTESYGGPGIQPLTSASGPWLREHGFLSPRGALTIGHRAQSGDLDAFACRYAALGVRVERLGRAGIARHVAGLRADWCEGVFEPDCCDIDVARLHQHYLGAARRGGAELRCGARLQAIDRGQSGWRLGMGDGQTATTTVLVNAAGAWADAVAELAGLRPIGITPLRRTVVQLRTVPAPPSMLPLVLDIGESFYFKPEAGRLWLSPHDETPSPPCDAAAEEIDVALAISRFEQVVDWRIEHAEQRWAGLRSFAPDRLPVYGFDPADPGFFWFAGQGGFGIQSAPAAAELAARLLLGKAQGTIDPARYSPRRFD